MAADPFDVERQVLVAAIRTQAKLISAEIGKSGIDERILSVLGKVLRHEFVPVELQPYAYMNRPLPIGHSKTISQPLMVAVMTDLLDISSGDVVLEIGTGLGYQTAILAELAGTIYSIELIEELANQARQRLRRQRYTNIEIKVGNGY
jgi:protein-L-isoaspartate(D-aspartate) O-methyltransferase